MESAELKNNEVTLVNKGIVYYIVQLVALPFKLAWWVIKFIFHHIKIYLGWLKEYDEYRTKQKSLNKILSRSIDKGEIL